MVSCGSLEEKDGWRGLMQRGKVDKEKREETYRYLPLDLERPQPLNPSFRAPYRVEV